MSTMQQHNWIIRAPGAQILSAATDGRSHGEPALWQDPGLTELGVPKIIAFGQAFRAAKPKSTLQAQAPPSISMEGAKQLTLPNMSEAFMKTADVLPVLDDGVAILCHSQILSMHSAVLCNMLADLSRQKDEPVKVPLAGFTEAQCSALLAVLYEHKMFSEGAPVKGHDAADHDGIVSLARFAHMYDAPLALRHATAHLTDIMSRRFRIKECAGMTGETCDKVVLEWALMADRLDMHELCGHCERAMVMYWEHFRDKPELIDQLSSGAIQRIAKGLHATPAALVASI